MTLLRPVNSPIWIPNCDSQSSALFDLFISSDASICSTMAFPSLGNSDNVVVSVSIEFLSNWKWDTPFYCIAYDYSHVDWDSLCDHLKNSVLLLLLVNFSSGFRLKLMYICYIITIRSYLTHLHGFQLFMLLP